MRFLGLVTDFLIATWVCLCLTDKLACARFGVFDMTASCATVVIVLVIQRRHSLEARVRLLGNWAVADARVTSERRPIWAKSPTKPHEPASVTFVVDMQYG